MSRLIPISLLLCFFWAKSPAQDTIIFEKNWPYLAFVQEDLPSEIIFRKFNTRDSLLFVIEKRFITEIWYSDPKLGRKPVEGGLITMEKPLDIWVTLSDTIAFFKGSVQSLNDSTLFLKKNKKLMEGTKGLLADIVYVFPYQKIHKIEVRQRNKVRRYATLGAIGGFAIGTLTGLIVFKEDAPCDPLGPDGRPCDESLFSPRSKLDKSLLLGAGTAGAGFLTGGIIGSVRLTIPIGGRKDVYGMAIPRLKRLSKIK